MSWKWDEEKPYIFVSYSHEDKKQVEECIEHLCHLGANIWYDNGLTAGKSWTIQAKNKIQDPKCKAILFFASVSALVSENVKKELDCGSNAGVTIIPVNFESKGFREIYQGDIRSKHGGKSSEKMDVADSIINEYLHKEVIYLVLGSDNFYKMAKEALNQIDASLIPDESTSEEKKDTPSDKTVSHTEEEPMKSKEITPVPTKTDDSFPTESTIEEKKDIPSDKMVSHTAEEPAKPIKIAPVPVKTGDSLHNMLLQFMEEHGYFAAKYKTATPEEKKQYAPDSNNRLYNIVKDSIPPMLKSAPFLADAHYSCQGSCGKGNWSTCPWIAIFNRYITNTTTEGVDVIYLLNKDTKVLYLSMNQGIAAYEREIEATEKKNGKGYYKSLGFRSKDAYIEHLLKKSAEKIRKAIGTGSFSSDAIDTGVPGYNFGNIISRAYTVDTLPDDAGLFADLQEMVKKYDQYYDLHKKEFSELKPAPRGEK